MRWQASLPLASTVLSCLPLRSARRCLHKFRRLPLQVLAVPLRPSDLAALEVLSDQRGLSLPLPPQDLAVLLLLLRLSHRCHPLDLADLSDQRDLLLPSHLQVLEVLAVLLLPLLLLRL